MTKPQNYLSLGSMTGLPLHIRRLIRQQIVRYPFLGSVPLWTAALTTGVVSVLFADVFARAEQLSEHWQTSYWFAAISPACFVISWYLVHRFAPQAKGSGIPQVMAAIAMVDGAKTENRRPAFDALLGKRMMFIKVISAIICVIGGGAIGREGPTIQIAAGIFFMIYLLVRPIFPAMSMESWLIAGGGAGIAAAFNTPLGGLVYAIEELATKHFALFRTTLISSVMIAGLAALWLAGNYLYFGAMSVDVITVQDHFFAVVLGILGGLGGGIFGVLLTRVAQLRKSFRSPGALVGCAAICGLLMVAMVWSTRAGAIGPGRSLVLGLLSGKIEAGWDFVATRFFGQIISYAGGGAGGIFSPSLATGAAIGALLAKVAHLTHTDFFILMGMVGFLTGVTHAPFTSMVLLLEMTDRHSTIFPMMLATLSAFVVSRLISRRGFYEIMKDDIFFSFTGTHPLDAHAESS